MVALRHNGRYFKRFLSQFNASFYKLIVDNQYFSISEETLSQSSVLSLLETKDKVTYDYFMKTFYIETKQCINYYIDTQQFLHEIYINQFITY